MTIKEKQQRKQLLNQKVDNLKKVIDKVLYYVCAPFIYGFYIYPHKFFRYMYKKFIVNFKIDIEDKKFSTKNIKKHLEKQIIKSFINYNVKEIFIGCSDYDNYRNEECYIRKPTGSELFTMREIIMPYFKSSPESHYFKSFINNRCTLNDTLSFACIPCLFDDTLAINSKEFGIELLDAKHLPDQYKDMFMNCPEVAYREGDNEYLKTHINFRMARIYLKESD